MRRPPGLRAGWSPTLPADAGPATLPATDWAPVAPGRPGAAAGRAGGGVPGSSGLPMLQPMPPLPPLPPATPAAMPGPLAGAGAARAPAAGPATPAGLRPARPAGAGPEFRPTQPFVDPLPLPRRAPADAAGRAARPAPEFRPTQPAPEFRPTQPAPEFRPTQPAPEFRATQPAAEFRATQPYSDFLPTQPAPEGLAAPRPARAAAEPAAAARAPAVHTQRRHLPPAPAPQAEGHWQVAGRPGEHLVLMPGQMHFGHRVASVRTLLGSCVAITLWHPEKHVGGMCHFLLPSRQRRGTEPADGRYGDEAVATMVQALQALRTAPSEYVAHLYGGADTMSGVSAARFNIGERNIEQGWSLIDRYGFQLDGVDVGEDIPRMVSLTLATGIVTMRRGTGSAPDHLRS